MKTGKDAVTGFTGLDRGLTPGRESEVMHPMVVAAAAATTAAAELGYSTITDENIAAILTNMVQGADAAGVVTTPQQRINAADAEAIGLINQHKYGMQMGAMGNQMQNQQNMYQQQMMQQQMKQYQDQMAQLQQGMAMIAQTKDGDKNGNNAGGGDAMMASMQAMMNTMTQQMQMNVQSKGLIFTSLLSYLKS